MSLATDLTEFIQKFGSQIAASADATLNPMFTPGKDPLPDLSTLESCRTLNSGQPFSFYPSQHEKTAGVVAGLKAKGRAWLIAEMGSGKSPMSLAAVWTLLPKAFRLLIMCPGHIVRKWHREVCLTIPNVHCRIIRNFSDMLDFHKTARSCSQPMVAVIGKDTAKLGLDVDRPCAARRKLSMQIRLASPDDVEPDDKGFHKIITGDKTEYEVTRIVDVACCPICGAPVTDGSHVLSHSEYLSGNQPLTCNSCGDRLITNARGFRKNPHIDRYVQRKMKGVFDCLIADEVHELASAESIQGQTFGTLASACRYTIALTGTLIGGKASDLHAPLWRMSPALLTQRAFNIQNFKGSKISAIARNERAFVRRYGVLEHQVTRGISDDFNGRVRRGACGRKKTYKSEERPKPGISPDLFNHFLLDRAVFMELSELGPALPSVERILIPCSMNPQLSSAYKKLDDELKQAIRERSRKSKGPSTLATTRIQVLDAYLDAPWNWNPITAPVYDDFGKIIGRTVVARPADLGANHIDSKDQKLIEIVKDELRQGRKCCIYPQFTGEHDVRQKLASMLATQKVRAVILPDTVKPEAREDWIVKHLDDMDVLIAHPKRVMTGLDLIQFPSLIWYQVGYSTHVLRQASARARRPMQTKPCKVFFLFYAGTIQEQALTLMGEKESASQALEGVFDCHALQAMMNGGKSDDIIAALANSLETTRKFDAVAAWKEPDVVAAKILELDLFELEVTHQPLLLFA